MLRTFLAIALLATSSSWGQTYNFQIENGKTYWQAIYKKDISAKAIEEILSRNGYFKAVSTSDNELVFRIEDLAMDFEGVGKRVGNTSMYISGSVWDGLAIIEFKEGRYRVTVKDLMCDMNIAALDVALRSKDPIEQMALVKSNTEFRPGFLKRDAEIFNHTFNKIFDFQQPVKNDDW